MAARASYRPEGGLTAILGRLTNNGLSVYCSAIGALLLCIALWLLARRMLINRGGRADGWILRYRERRKAHVGEITQYQPTVRFRPRHGPEVEFESQMTADPQRWKIGHLVAVAYRKDRPEQAEIARPSRLWLAPIALLLLGIGALAAAWKAGG